MEAKVQELRLSVVTGSLTKSSSKRQAKLMCYLICHPTYNAVMTNHNFHSITVFQHQKGRYATGLAGLLGH